MPQIQSTLFISHGAPDILISQQASVEALRKIGSCLSPHPACAGAKAYDNVDRLHPSAHGRPCGH